MRTEQRPRCPCRSETKTANRAGQGSHASVLPCLDLYDDDDADLDTASSFCTTLTGLFPLRVSFCLPACLLYRAQFGVVSSVVLDE